MRKNPVRMAAIRKEVEGLQAAKKAKKEAKKEKKRDKKDAKKAKKEAERHPGARLRSAEMDRSRVWRNGATGKSGLLVPIESEESCVEATKGLGREERRSGGGERKITSCEEKARPRSESV